MSILRSYICIKDEIKLKVVDFVNRVVLKGSENCNNDPSILIQLESWSFN